MSDVIHQQADRLRARFELSTAFNPSGPVSNRDMLVGRSEQVGRLLAAVGQRGQSVILFGERGVGKTSLASLIHEFWGEFARESGVVAARVNAEPTSTFETLWANILEVIQDQYEKHGFRFPVGDSWTELFTEVRNNGATPHSVRRLLDLADRQFIIVIDEFDQVEDPDCIPLFASTIKSLSDYQVRVTLILVGVADTVDELIADHASIDRAAIQVPMPRMSIQELEGIVTQGYEKAGMRAEPNVVSHIGRLAQGLPHYAHRLGQEAGYAAIDHGSRLTVEAGDVELALKKAISLTQASITTAYDAAISSSKENLFSKVLLACALAPVDDLNYFAAADVREPLFAILKDKRLEIPQFIRHLKDFCEPKRGRVLQTRGDDWKRRYRFRNPLMRPYVVLRGIEAGLTTLDIVRSFERPEPLNTGEQRKLI